MDDLFTQSTSPISAVKFIRRMRGGSQAVLLECDDGNLYIVKMVGCSGGPNTLANEWLGSVLANSAGLPVAKSKFILLSSPFLASNPYMRLEMPTGKVPTAPGLYLGSLLVGEPSGPRRALQYLPQAYVPKVANRAVFLGMYLFDIWAGQRAGRKAIFQRTTALSSLEATFINHRHLFGGGEWKSLEQKSIAYHHVVSLYSGLWSSRAVSSWIEIFRTEIPKVLSWAIAIVPNHWYVGNLSAVRASLLTRLDDLPALIERDSDFDGRSPAGTTTDDALHIQGDRLC